MYYSHVYFSPTRPLSHFQQQVFAPYSQITGQFTPPSTVKRLNQI